MDLDDNTDGEGLMTRPKARPDSIQPDLEVSPVASLLDFVGAGEGDYDSSNTGTVRVNGNDKIVHFDNSTVRDGKKLSEMTIGEVRPYQEITDPNDKDRLFTIGKYQMIKSTFDTAVKGLGLSDDTVLTPEVQEKMGIYLISKKPGRGKLNGFLTGDTSISTDSAMLDLAKEFASIPVPFDIKKGKNGKRPFMDLKAGDSFYKTPGSGGNSANFHTVDETIAILNGVRGALTSELAPSISQRPKSRPTK